MMQNSCKGYRDHIRDYTRCFNNSGQSQPMMSTTDALKQGTILRNPRTKFTHISDCSHDNYFSISVKMSSPNGS